MATIKKDHVGLIIRTGFGFTKRLLVKSKDTGLPIDLAGASARLDIKLNPEDAEPLFSFISGASEGGILTLNEDPGAVDFFASAEATADITLSAPQIKGVHDFKLTLPGQEPLFLFGGPALIKKGTMSTIIDGELYVLDADGAASEILEEQGGDQIVEILIPGVQGPAASAEGFNFTQISASTTWTIAHNLGYRPVVETWTTGGAKIFGSAVNLSVNVVQITFNTALAGTARCV